MFCSYYDFRTGESFSRNSLDVDVFLTVAGIVGVLIIILLIKKVLQIYKPEKKITAMIKDTEDKAAATGLDTNYRDHKAMRVKQAGFGSAPVRDYLEHMVEDEG